MRNTTRQNADGRTLLWIAASGSFMPEALKNWGKVSLSGISGLISEDGATGRAYSLIFEATCNSRMDYDPARAAGAVLARFGRPPAALVALVAPSLEVPVLAQHAIGCEVRQILGSQRVQVVTVNDRPSPVSASKLRKERTDSVPRFATGLDEALAIASGIRRGSSVDPAADAFVYAYTSKAFRRHDPFRSSALCYDRALQNSSKGLYARAKRAASLHPERDNH